VDEQQTMTQDIT